MGGFAWPASRPGYIRLLFVELALGEGRVLISEETPSLNALTPPTIGGSPVLLHVDVDDVDAVAKHALEAGAVVEIPDDITSRTPPQV